MGLDENKPLYRCAQLTPTRTPTHDNRGLDTAGSRSRDPGWRNLDVPPVRWPGEAVVSVLLSLPGIIAFIIVMISLVIGISYARNS